MENTRRLIRIGVGDGQEIADGPLVEPGHLEAQLPIDQAIARVFTCLESEPSRRCTAPHNTNSLGNGDSHDGRGRRYQKAVRADALIQDRDDQSVRDPADHQR